MKAAVHNLGCKTNAYEAEAMEQALKDAGFDIVGFNSDDFADVYVVNTCSVTNIADRKSRQMLHKAKQKNPNAVIVAVGCFVQEVGEKILETEAVDICLGSNDKHLLIDCIKDFLADGKKKSIVSDISKKAEFENLHISEKPVHTRAFIKIEDGCDRFCSYCIIPHVRGRVRSRKPEDITGEVKVLADKGVKEIVLTGINMSAYGKDLSEDMDISDIILALNDIEKIERIRVSSVEPQLITKDFLDKIKPAYKLCPHFHLSLQSGSDGVLSRMNRGYTTEEYFAKAKMLREYYNDPTLTTDVIVGFPGETDGEFKETAEFIKKVKFFDIHVFQFSPREGTPAAKMPGKVDTRTKKVRSAVLTSLVDEMRQSALQRYVGGDAKVLIEEQVMRDGIKFYSGHTPDYVKVIVEVDDADPTDLTGEIVGVKVTGVGKGEVFGEF